MAHLDIAALYATLDAERQQRGLSWREVSRQTGVSASTLSRMGKGESRPDVDAFATLVHWLGADANVFLRPDEGEKDIEHDLSPPADVAARLRARGDLSPRDVDAIETVVAVLYELTQRPETG